MILAVFIELSLCARDNVKGFVYISLFYPYNNTMRKMLLFFPFYRLERLGAKGQNEWNSYS